MLGKEDAQEGESSGMRIFGREDAQEGGYSGRRMLGSSKFGKENAQEESMET